MRSNTLTRVSNNPGAVHLSTVCSTSRRRRFSRGFADVLWFSILETRRFLVYLYS